MCWVSVVVSAQGKIYLSMPAPQKQNPATRKKIYLLPSSNTAVSTLAPLVYLMHKIEIWKVSEREMQKPGRPNIDPSLSRRLSAGT